MTRWGWAALGAVSVTAALLFGPAAFSAVVIPNPSDQEIGRAVVVRTGQAVTAPTSSPSAHHPSGPSTAAPSASGSHSATKASTKSSDDNDNHDGDGDADDKPRVIQPNRVVVVTTKPVRSGTGSTTSTSKSDPYDSDESGGSTSGGESHESESDDESDDD